MTFLEFVCERLLGPPTYRRGDGESHWPCPGCGHARFHTMPHRPPYKDRFRCWVCPFRGDEHDLLRHFHPRFPYDERLAWLGDLRREYDARPAAGDDGAAPDPSFPRGAGSTAQAPPDPQVVAAAWADLTREERGALAAAVALARDRCAADPEGLLWYCYHSARWFGRPDEPCREEEEREWRRQVERCRQYLRPYPVPGGRNGRA